MLQGGFGDHRHILGEMVSDLDRLTLDLDKKEKDLRAELDLKPNEVEPKTTLRAKSDNEPGKIDDVEIMRRLRSIVNPENPEEKYTLLKKIGSG